MDEFGAPFFSGVALLLESVAAIIVARVVIARGAAAAIRVSAFCLRVQVEHGTHLVSFLSINALVHFPARAVFVLLLQTRHCRRRCQRALVVDELRPEGSFSALKVVLVRHPKDASLKTAETRKR